MELDRPEHLDSPAADTVAMFLNTLLAGRLDAAAELVTRDMVFLGRHGWHGQGSPFRDDAKLQKGSGVPNKDKVGSVSKSQVEEIAKSKMEDLNAESIEAAMNIIAGTARSMGIEIR